MTLFEFPSQYREKAVIWRIFGMLPLYGPLAEGHVFRWFAVNIPMDLLTGGRFTSDIDIIACLRPYPQHRVLRDADEFIYKTWEVKVSLLDKDGHGRSLKAGKTRSTIKQLEAYRDFGSPEVSLLEAYILGPEYLAQGGDFAPKTIHRLIYDRAAELRKNGFGYQLIPFGHAKDGDIDVGLFALRSGNVRVLQPSKNQIREPFSRLVNDLNEFFGEEIKDQQRKAFVWIVFCRRCRRLRLIDSKKEYVCPRCQADLILQ